MNSGQYDAQCGGGDGGKVIDGWLAVMDDND
jgi:hypothetical protein